MPVSGQVGEREGWLLVPNGAKGKGVVLMGEGGLVGVVGGEYKEVVRALEEQGSGRVPFGVLEMQKKDVEKERLAEKAAAKAERAGQNMPECDDDDDDEDSSDDGDDVDDEEKEGDVVCALQLGKEAPEGGFNESATETALAIGNEIAWAVGIAESCIVVKAVSQKRFECRIIKDCDPAGNR